MERLTRPLFGLAFATLGVGFVVFIAASTLLSTLNIAAGIAAGLVGLAGTTMVALRITGRDWRAVTLVSFSRVKPADVAMACLMAAASSVSLGGWFGQLSERVFPTFILELFDTSRILAGAMTNAIETSLVALAVVVLAPLFEEFFFRGVFFRGLTHRLSVGASVLLSAAVFSAYHLDPVGFLARTGIGALLAVLVWKTGSLWPAIAAHFTNNALAMGLMLAKVEDRDVPVWVSFTGLGVLVLTLVWVWRRRVEPMPPEVAKPAVSIGRAAWPWAAALGLAALIILAVDYRGTQLTRIDLSAPLLGAAEPAAEAELALLRKQARAGQAEVSEYEKKRSALSEARFEALFAGLRERLKAR